MRLLHRSKSHEGGIHYQSLFDCSSALESERVKDECRRPVDDAFNRQIQLGEAKRRGALAQQTKDAQKIQLKPLQVPFFKEIVYGTKDVRDEKVDEEHPGLLPKREGVPPKIQDSLGLKNILFWSTRSPMTRQAFDKIKPFDGSAEGAKKLRALREGGNSPKQESGVWYVAGSST